MTARALLPLLAGLALAAQAQPLRMVFVDTEGGQATLMLTPRGESLLVDAGFPGNNGRDSDRIVAAAHRLGILKIDYLLVTHYHLDHVGGVPELAAKMPIGVFIDHGDNTENSAQAKALEDAYRKVLATGAKRLTVKPGDVLPLKGVRIEIVAARGDRIAKAVKGGGQANPLCPQAERRADDPTENARSIGFLLTYGRFRFVDLADLTWNKELELACPQHLIGPVDLYLTTHHGLDQSGCPQIVHGLRPRVAIMNNGARKGGSPAAWRIVASSPGLQDLWQLHYSLAGGKEANVSEERIANLEERCQGFAIEVEAGRDGVLTVRNQRNGYAKTYRP
ncbi:MAG: MBL fold metallo-hydrolase [Bryobacteraceae bacterium]|nr:MBL fold metallo-hydrolase [Bryobacteraceae bacterium]MCX7604668.1 MBL fold metallo-hydrolase [Bryobacteraceae bacterium]